MCKTALLSIIFCLSTIPISAQAASGQTPGQKGNKAIQDSLKSVSSVPAKQSSQQKWVESVLGRVEMENKMDSIQAAYKDTTTSPYEIMKAQKKEAIRLLIMRPVSSFGVSTLKNKWLLLLCETYMYFRLGAIPVLSIVPPDTCAGVLPYYDEYQSAIATEKYKKAARELSVPYLLYLQCGFTNIGIEVNFLGDILSADNDKSIVNVSKTFPLKELGEVLDQFAIQIVERMGIEPEKQNRLFLDTPLMSKKANSLKMLGEYISGTDKLEAKFWEAFLKDYNNFLTKNPEMIIGYYAAAKFCDSAKKYKEAAGFSYALIHKLGHTYPPAYLMTARYYRLGENYDEALRVVNLASDVMVIQQPLKEEKARIEEGARKNK